MSTLKIEFSGGGVFYARLLESEAPKTCATICHGFHLSISFINSIVSGQALVAPAP